MRDEIARRNAMRRDKDEQSTNKTKFDLREGDAVSYEGEAYVLMSTTGGNQPASASCGLPCSTCARQNWGPPPLSPWQTIGLAKFLNLQVINTKNYCFSMFVSIFLNINAVEISPLVIDMSSWTGTHL